MSNDPNQDPNSGYGNPPYGIPPQGPYNQPPNPYGPPPQGPYGQPQGPYGPPHKVLTINRRVPMVLHPMANHRVPMVIHHKVLTVYLHTNSQVTAMFLRQ